MPLNPKEVGDGLEPDRRNIDPERPERRGLKDFKILEKVNPNKGLIGFIDLKITEIFESEGKKLKLKEPGKEKVHPPEPEAGLASGEVVAGEGAIPGLTREQIRALLGQKYE